MPGLEQVRSCAAFAFDICGELQQQTILYSSHLTLKRWCSSTNYLGLNNTLIRISWIENHFNPSNIVEMYRTTKEHWRSMEHANQDMWCLFVNVTCVTLTSRRNSEALKIKSPDQWQAFKRVRVTGFCRNSWSAFVGMRTEVKIKWKLTVR